MNYVAVGAFVLGLGALAIAGVLWLASGGAWSQRYDIYLAVSDESVAGLNLNAPVKYSGVDVGKVREIRLDPANPERVLLVFDIEHGTPIRRDTEAVLKTQGLTGIAYVELGGGAKDSPLLPPSEREPYPVIRTKASLSTRIENVLTNVLAQLDRTSGNIDAVLSDANRAAFTQALADIAAVMHVVAERKGTIDAGIGSAARTFDKSERVAAQLGPVIERVGRAADAVETLGQEAARASKGAGQAASSVSADSRRFADQALPELQKLLLRLNDLSTSLQRLSEQTERSPAGLLLGHGAVPDGPGETSPGVAKP